MSNPYSAKHGVDARKGDTNAANLDYSPTSALEQHNSNGFVRTAQPVGDSGPCTYPPPPGSPSLGGTAGVDSDAPIAATHPAAVAYG